MQVPLGLGIKNFKRYSVLFSMEFSVVKTSLMY